MLSTTRKLSLYCAIAAAANIIAALLLFLILQTLDAVFTVKFCIMLYMLTTSGILLGLTCAIRSACQDIEIDNEYFSKNIQELKKKVHELENKNS